MRELFHDAVMFKDVLAAAVEVQMPQDSSPPLVTRQMIVDDLAKMPRHEVVRLLLLIASLKPGDMFPDEFNGERGWGPPLSALCERAAELIKQDETTKKAPPVRGKAQHLIFTDGPIKIYGVE